MADDSSRRTATDKTCGPKTSLVIPERSPREDGSAPSFAETLSVPVVSRIDGQSR